MPLDALTSGSGSDGTWRVNFIRNRFNALRERSQWAAPAPGETAPAYGRMDFR